jgi:hypothetical protein
LRYGYLNAKMMRVRKFHEFLWELSSTCKDSEIFSFNKSDIFGK